MSDLVGHSLGRYYILEQLGEGGMATVYKALDTRLEREVAIKIIRRAAFPPDQMERMSKRFEREARSLARLSHRNIVKVLDYGEYEGSPYLVMEYLPSGTLKDRLSRGRLSWQNAFRLLKPVAQALAHAHENQIIHRDVKPANILVSRSGEPMLSDFGIAKLLENEGTTELTATGAGVGTPEYMAPEQGMGKADERADIYALGVVLYQVITGHVPYRADTPLAVLIKKNTEPLPRPTRFVPDLPAAVEYLLVKALARDPSQRYQSMNQFIEALDKILASGGTLDGLTIPPSDQPTRDLLPVDERPSTSGGTAKRKSNSTPWILAVGVLALCCAVVAVGVLAQSFFPSAPTPSAPLSTATLPGPTSPSPTSLVLTTEVSPTFPPLPPPDSPTLTPTWTASPVPPPVSQELAFVSDRDNGSKHFRVHIIDPDNPSGGYQVFPNPAGYERVEWPSFCGSGLAAEVIDEDDSLPQWIYLFKRDGSSSKWISKGEVLGVPRCSPNEWYMAYSAQKGAYWVLMLADLGSGKLVNEFDTHDYGKVAGYASWDVTSQLFIFEVISSNEDIALLRVTNVSTSPALKQFELGQNARFVALSPDGRQTAYECGSGQLCVTDLNSGKTQTLYQTRSDVNLGWTESVTPVWSADGQWIYFASVDGGDWDIFRIHPDGSGVENVTRDWSSNEIHPTLNWQVQ
jgi:serine/threonine protein kinase